LRVHVHQVTQKSGDTQGKDERRKIGLKFNIPKVPSLNGKQKGEKCK